MNINNDETPQCANTNGVSMSVTLRETNMNIVAKNDLNFHGISLSPVQQLNEIWLTSADLARALGYASSKSVSTIYSRNSDEFTGSMSMVIKMMTNGINNNLREKSVRVFSLRGCHLIAMFATTDKAKEFRRWVLDILDRQIESSPIAKQFTDEELYDLACLWSVSQIISDDAKIVKSAMELVGSPIALKINVSDVAVGYFMDKARALLLRESKHIAKMKSPGIGWERELKRLNGIKELH
ncbi:Bro-N domain-containing protein [Serratia sp. CY83950]|uniref:BRO-N domain-containing protein n=1 Tax=Serratia sp. CY83950 TaxID=3383692 RepID=UPI003FA19051